MPCPGAGTNASTVERGAGLVRAAEPAQPGQRQHDRRRIRRSASFRSRVSTLPRSSARPRGRARSASSCERRRRLERADPRARGQRVDRPRADERVARVLRRPARRDLEARRAARPARPSRCARRGRSRRRAAPPRSPSRSATCRRARRRGRRRCVIVTSSGSSPACAARSRSATWRACASASALPRVPMRSVFSASGAVRLDRIGVTSARPLRPLRASSVRASERRALLRCPGRTARAAPARRRRCAGRSPRSFRLQDRLVEEPLHDRRGDQLERARGRLR